MRFQNGHKFAFCARCCPPDQRALPYISTQMMGPSGASEPVVGKVDTGAFRTMLNYDTAGNLGIVDPSEGAIETDTAHTASDDPIEYHVHEVLVEIVGEEGIPFSFPLKAAFAEKVKRNLFGVDWLRHVCLAVDEEAVHFLKD